MNYEHILEECKLDNFESNIGDLCSNFVDSDSFLTLLLYLSQTWVTQLILAISL